MTDQSAAGPLQHHFSPYSNNGGTVVAIAGDDFAVIASDTRLSEGFLIHQRDFERCQQLTPLTVLGTCGFNGDALALRKNIKTRLAMYEHQHSKHMNCCAIAQMLSTMLYYKRFFPYYTYNIVAGLDQEGKGAVFSYDPVGSVERVQMQACGSASTMVQSFLDNQVYGKNLVDNAVPELTKERSVMLIKDAFISAAERDIETGDSVQLLVIDKDGITNHIYPLRKD